MGTCCVGTVHTYRGWARQAPSGSGAEQQCCDGADSFSVFGGQHIPSALTCSMPC